MGSVQFGVLYAIKSFKLPNSTVTNTCSKVLNPPENNFISFFLSKFHQLNRFHFYQLTYLLTPWCKVPLEQLTGLQLVKKFPAFHGTKRFITALTSVRQLSLSWASPYTHIPPPGDPSYIIHPSTPRFPQWSLSLRFPHQHPVHPPLPTHTRHIPSPSHSSRFYHPHNIG